MIWARMLAYITGAVDQELLLRIRFSVARYSFRFEVVVLFGMLSLVAQFVYCLRIVSGLNQEHALNPETMTVTFGFSPTHDFFDHKRYVTHVSGPDKPMSSGRTRFEWWGL
jgi:hypothetical protein